MAGRGRQLDLPSPRTTALPGLQMGSCLGPTAKSKEKYPTDCAQRAAPRCGGDSWQEPRAGVPIASPTLTRDLATRTHNPSQPRTMATIAAVRCSATAARSGTAQRQQQAAAVLRASSFRAPRLEARAAGSSGCRSRGRLSVLAFRWDPRDIKASEKIQDWCDCCKCHSPPLTAVVAAALCR